MSSWQLGRCVIAPALRTSCRAARLFLFLFLSRQWSHVVSSSKSRSYFGLPTSLLLCCVLVCSPQAAVQASLIRSLNYVHLFKIIFINVLIIFSCWSDSKQLRVLTPKVLQFHSDEFRDNSRTFNTDAHMQINLYWNKPAFTRAAGTFHFSTRWLIFAIHTLITIILLPQGWRSGDLFSCCPDISKKGMH